MSSLKRKTKSIFEFIYSLTSSISSTPKAKSVLYFDESGQIKMLPEYGEVEHACSALNKIELTLLIENDSGEVYRIPYTLRWHDYILSITFPNKPPTPDTDIYDFITDYAFPVYESMSDKNLILLDSTNHHPALPTHPHHLHFYTSYGTKKDAQNFSGQLSDLVTNIAYSCKLH